MCYFNPRSPRGERPQSGGSIRPTPIFQSTLPARGATWESVLHGYRLTISIHAPREGERTLCGERLRDHYTDFNPRSPRGERRPSGEPHMIIAGISIHAPREGSDREQSVFFAFAFQFQSTLPARGATCGLKPSDFFAEFQSTLPARGATLTTVSPAHLWLISIHAPREGSDVAVPCDRAGDMGFQSTLPARGATKGFMHKLLKKEDFQSTLPARGATLQQFSF